MSTVCVTILYLLCCSCLARVAPAIHIGAILDTQTREGREQKVAIDIAMQHFNFSNSTLFFRVTNSDGRNLLKSSSKAEKLIQWGAEAIIIGAGTWPEVATVADIASLARIPLLSLATNAPPTSAPRPFLVTMSHAASSQVRCIAELIKSFNWRRVILIYEDDDYGSISATVGLMANAIRQVGAEIDLEAGFPPIDKLSNAQVHVHHKLEVIKQQLTQVYIVLRSSQYLATLLFKEATELGMMTKGHVWIANDDISRLLDSSFNASFITSYMQGLIGIRNYIDEKDENRSNFSREFKERFEQEYKDKGEKYFHPGISAFRAYDTVHVIACATSKKEIKQNKLLEEIIKCGSEGVGSINFRIKDGTISEATASSTFEIINVMGRSYMDLGYWSEEYGFQREEGEIGHHWKEVKVLGPVYFPGRPERAPGGWGRLKIGVPARASFEQFVKVQYYEKGKVKEVTGFCIDVFKETLKRLKYDLEYHEFIPFDDTYDELISQVALKVFDAVVGDITILANRLDNITFTEPYIGSGLSMLVRVKPNHKVWVLTKPFAKTVWMLIVILLIHTGIILWYLETKQKNPNFHGRWWTQLGQALWLIFASIFNAHGKVYSHYSKAVILVWLSSVLILGSSYTATLSSILTTQKLEPIVHHNKVGCDGDSFVVKYLQDVLGYKEQSIQTVGRAENYTNAFDSGNITAAYLETPYLRVFLSQHSGYTVYGETHRLGGFGFVFQSGSPIAADISEAILKLVEDGTLKHLEKKWFSIILSNCPGPHKSTNRDSMNLDGLWELFLLSGGTTTAVFLLFLVQMFRRSRPSSNATMSQKTTSAKTGHVTDTDLEVQRVDNTTEEDVVSLPLASHVDQHKDDS